MDVQPEIEKVIEIAREAVKSDKLEEYEKAYDLYFKAAELIYLLLKKEQKPDTIKIYKERILGYSESAKYIKEKKLNTRKNVQGNDKETEEDEYKKKFETQLDSCKLKEKPNVKWEDIAGLEKAKEILKEIVLYPIKYPQVFLGKRKPWKSILLYGPPGTDKIILAKAAVTEIQGNFFYVSAENIKSNWMGESERLIKGLFEQARKNKPAIIFLDEIEKIIGAMSDNEDIASIRLKGEYLVQLKGFQYNNEGILIIGTTNIPWNLDPAILRIFQKKIYISLPDFDSRKVLFDLNLKGKPNTLTEEQIEELTEKTEGFTLIKEAINESIKKCESAEYFKKIPGNDEEKCNYTPCDNNEPDVIKMKMSEIQESDTLLLPKVIYEDFLEVLKNVKATVNPEDLIKHEEFTKDFGQEG